MLSLHPHDEGMAVAHMFQVSTVLRGCSDCKQSSLFVLLSLLLVVLLSSKSESNP